jgi:alanyl-tRNA synthetase
LTAQLVLGIQEPSFISYIVDFIIEASENSCRLQLTRDKLLSYIVGEEKRFEKTLVEGTKQLEKSLQEHSSSTSFSGKQALLLEKRAGMPKTMIEYELFQRGLRLDRPGYEQAWLHWRKQTQ